MGDETIHESLKWRAGDSTCFGCSAENPRGLQLDFFRVGEREVECRLTPPDELNGAPGIVHGGVQTTILDEAMGYACHAGADEVDVVTVEMHLRFRRPARTGTAMVARARVVDDDAGTCTSRPRCPTRRASCSPRPPPVSGSWGDGHRHARPMSAMIST